jgi:ribose 5-phosphate isomerase B
LIASDHAGVDLKSELIRRLPDWKWEDLGPQDTSRVDYPDYAERLASQISSGASHRGVLICGSGIGMSITANKFSGVRAAVVDNPSTARLSREHNDSNVLCLGARFLAPEYAAEIVELWLRTEFSSEGRHQDRLKKIEKIETKNLKGS